ncbi:MAG TPA: nucleotidyl transferase AbiEii/AbiGii toxin family protein [Vicinamibacterales bacterium]
MQQDRICASSFRPNLDTRRSSIAPRHVLGLTLPVAAIADVLLGKIWAFQDPQRRASKRQKDLADISRLLEADPRLRRHVRADILDRLL